MLQLGRLNIPEVAALPTTGDWLYQLVGFNGVAYFWDGAEWIAL